MFRDELKSSVVKNEILKTIDAIDEKHAGFAGFFKTSKNQTGERYPDFVMKQIDLPDLLFLQYVIQELKKPAYEKNIYKAAVLATALKCKKTLLTPHINQSQQLSCAIFFGGMIFCQGWICLIGAGSFLLSEHIADWRLSKKLEGELALKFNHGKIAKLDNYDTNLDRLAKVSSSGMHTIEKSLEHLPSLSKK